MALLNENDIERARVLLTNTVGVLCRNSLGYNRELQVQGLIGVTLDGKQVFLVSINELFVKEKDSSEVQETTVSCNSDEDEPVLIDDDGDCANSRTLSRPQASTVQSEDNLHSLSASQMLAEYSRNLYGGVGKELSPPMEVSAVYSLDGVNRRHHSSENSSHGSRSLSKKSSQQHFDSSIDNEKRAAENDLKQAQQLSVGSNYLSVNADKESIRCLENSVRPYVRDACTANRVAMSRNNSSGRVDGVEQNIASLSVQLSFDAMQHADEMKLVKREVQSPHLTVTSESSSCTTENDTKAVEIEHDDLRRFGQVTDLVSDASQSFCQTHSQYSATFDLNSLGVHVNSLGEPFWTVDEQQFVLRQNRNRIRDKSRAVHQCDYVNCGLRFCHRRHLLRHQTMKHGRPKGRISQFSALMLTEETLATDKDRLRFDDDVMDSR